MQRQDPAPEQGKMTIRFINSLEDSYVRRVTVNADMTVRAFLTSQGVKSVGDRPHCIRVNREKVSEDDILNHGDVVSLTPTKAEGAR